jgi:hypothetical protein
MNDRTNNAVEMPAKSDYGRARAAYQRAGRLRLIIERLRSKSYGSAYHVSDYRHSFGVNAKNLDELEEILDHVEERRRREAAEQTNQFRKQDADALTRKGFVISDNGEVAELSGPMKLTVVCSGERLLADLQLPDTGKSWNEGGSFSWLITAYDLLEEV